MTWQFKILQLLIWHENSKYFCIGMWQIWSRFGQKLTHAHTSVFRGMSERSRTQKAPSGQKSHLCVIDPLPVPGLNKKLWIVHIFIVFDRRLMPRMSLFWALCFTRTQTPNIIRLPVVSVPMRMSKNWACGLSTVPFPMCGSQAKLSVSLLDYTRRARVAPKRLFVSGEPNHPSW